MVKIPKWLLWFAILGAGGTGLSAIAQTELPFLWKELALMLPLQLAALGYVVWYWQNRSSTAPTNRHKQ